MSHEVIRMPCPECGTRGEATDPRLSRWRCTQCGKAFFLRRCSACARVSYVDGLQGFRTPWACTWCGQSNTGFSQNKDPAAATVAELAAELSLFSADEPSRDRESLVHESVVHESVVHENLAPKSPVPESPAPESLDHAGADIERRPGSNKRGSKWRLRRVAMIATAGTAVVIAAGLLALTRGHPAAGRATALDSHDRVMQAAQTGTRPIQVTASHVGIADIQGAAGQLSIVGTGTGQVMLTGELSWTGHAPVVQTQLDRAAGVLEVSIRCAPASPCSENLRLEVPASTATAVRQPAGRIVVTGLAGPLRLTAANADISASGLRSPSLTALITSGHMNVTFSAPPRQVTVDLASTQATLRLPSRVDYRVTRDVTSGYIGIAIPQAGSATRTVTARLHSSELELLRS